MWWNSLVPRTIDGRRLASTLLGLMCWVTLYGVSTPAVAVGSGQTSNRSPLLTARSVYLRQAEERAGQRMALGIERPGSVLQDPIVSAYVNRVAQRVLAEANLDQPIVVKVLNHPEFNAFSVPGGRVYLTVGLLKHLTSEDELASVLAHEIAHATAHDWAHQRAQLALVRARERTAWRRIPARGFAGLGRGRVNSGALAAWRRRAEEAADARGLQYLYQAKYDPSAAISVLTKASTLAEQNRLQPQASVQIRRETAVRLTLVQQGVRSLSARKSHLRKRPRSFVKMQRRLGVQTHPS